ncbi:MAG: hypothetical protein ACFFBS_03860 [Promethearchaeota archaeon]
MKKNVQEEERRKEERKEEVITTNQLWNNHSFFSNPAIFGFDFPRRSPKERLLILALLPQENSNCGRGF